MRLPGSESPGILSNSIVAGELRRSFFKSGTREDEKLFLLVPSGEMKSRRKGEGGDLHCSLRALHQF